MTFTANNHFHNEYMHKYYNNKQREKAFDNFISIYKMLLKYDNALTFIVLTILKTMKC